MSPDIKFKAEAAMKVLISLSNDAEIGKEISLMYAANRAWRQLRDILDLVSSDTRSRFL
jgi:hypothetical protein